MSITSNYEINSLTEFEKDLIRVIEEKFPAEAKVFLRKQAKDVMTQAKNDTPVDTGYTKAQWKMATKGKRGA